MLVLTRKAGQDIYIGHDGEIIVKVIQTSSRYVRLGIEAPSSIQIYREEIFERMRREKMLFVATELNT